MEGSTEYRFTWLPACIRFTNELGKKLTSQELNTRLGTVLRKTQRELSVSPRTWGDPRQNLRGMNATVYVKTYLRDGILFRYLVHKSLNFVFVQSVEPVEFGPFDI